MAAQSLLSWVGKDGRHQNGVITPGISGSPNRGSKILLSQTGVFNAGPQPGVVQQCYTQRTVVPLLLQCYCQPTWARKSSISSRHSSCHGMPSNSTKPSSALNGFLQCWHTKHSGCHFLSMADTRLPGAGF